MRKMAVVGGQCKENIFLSFPEKFVKITGRKGTNDTSDNDKDHSPHGAFQAQLQDLLTQSFSKASLLQVATNPATDMEQRPPRVPKLAWVQEEEQGPGPAPAHETEEVVPSKQLQEGAAVQRTREQERSRGRFRRTAQLVCKFIKRIREEETAMGTGLRAYEPIFKTKTSAALADMLVEEGFSNPKQVPAMVRYIHQWLEANQFAEHRLNRTLLDLTEERPADVVMTLLRVAPLCDRAALAMWKSIMCSLRTAEPAMLVLLDVLGSWPEHSTCTSNGDKTAVLTLAATVVMWKLLQLPCVPHMVTVYLPHLFVHLLFQVFFSTLDMPEEVDTFWKGCQQQYGLATSPNRFAVQTLKSLLCEMQHEDAVVAMEHKCGWDKLMCADTNHHAMGLLAKEMSCVSIPLCSRITRYLLRLLSAQEPRWELPTLAFFVESKKMWSLTESLVELLWDADGEIVSMTATLLNFIILDKDMLIPSPIALQLVEALLPLLDHDNSQVKLLSIVLLGTLVSLPQEKEKEALKTHVHQSLLPLFFHCHDENQLQPPPGPGTGTQVLRPGLWGHLRISAALQASQEMLLGAAEFLKRSELQKLVKSKKWWKFT
ncbi:hypothetical protein RLOC_00008039 [Lonchura striata]|uniref:Maestro/Maestro-like HEAT-repeats domain-containing protein n=1 Tax=Lonchura striata TaxID=40157 RepID=A0A218U775_9PASE|nr:hypothetical protein RLOC_00008039 [Lonchura striata domestica]